MRKSIGRVQVDTFDDVWDYVQGVTMGDQDKNYLSQGQ